MQQDIKESALFNELLKLKVDFLYTKNLYFAAADRLSKSENRWEIARKSAELAAVVISIVTTTTLFTPLPSYVPVISSIVSIILSLLVVFFPLNNQAQKFRNIANSYLFLYKIARHEEGRLRDGILTEPSVLDSVIQKLYNKQKHLAKRHKTLITNSQDMLAAKRQIDDGRATYTDLDLKV